ncbi:MAG: right-handed parallel beta-helix repeat-containing protein, partial [Ignavibacteriaceae bacterium]
MNSTLTALIIIFVLSFSGISFSQVYVSASGDDNNPGTIEQPLATIPAAVTITGPGDTIYVRGGVYSLTATISIAKDGTDGNMYYLFAYPGERPLLDFSLMPFGSSNRGIILRGSYWHIKGLDIKGAGDNGMNISGSNNIIEFCSFFENKDTGLQLGGGASDNRIINCDSYFNADPGHGNADGFAPKLSVGTNNYFYGCRAWQNSDDGWDGYLRESASASTTVENSWCFMNGYLKDGSPSSGNGNGYKMGGGDTTNIHKLAHDFTLINSIAFDNRVKGFDQNNNRGSMILQNCTGYRNGTNYSIPAFINDGETASVINSAVLGNAGIFGSSVIQQTNSWQSPFVVNTSDFISLDTAGVRGPRKPDGTLPDVNFLHLAEGSDLIDAGTDIGLPYMGAGPDLGAFESDPVVSVTSNGNLPAGFGLLQNYPNPFNPSTSITYQLNSRGFVTLNVYN